MKAIVEAPAKINLFLQVGPMRGDGYHPVRTVMQCVEWFDILELEPADGVGYLRVEPNLIKARLPVTSENLAWMAWKLMARELGLSGRGLNMKLLKNIPLAAGMGGGSADAAAVMLGLNHLHGRPVEPRRLLALAAELGSDVPFFLQGGTALAEGRGEEVTPLPSLPSLHVVLANPAVPLSTASVYRRFDETGHAAFEREDLEGFLSAMRTGNTADLLAALRNDLEDSCLALLPDAARLLDDVRTAMQRLGISANDGAAMVSGSGPTVFALLKEEGFARLLAEALAGSAPILRRTRFRLRGCRVLNA